VWIVSGPNPYVSRRGTFYLVEVEHGISNSVVAVDSANLKPLTCDACDKPAHKMMGKTAYCDACVARNKYGEPVELHGKVCILCSQRIGIGHDHLTSKDNEMVCEHCWKPESPRKPTHYIAMSGQHGYLPDSCNAYETYQSAVDEMASLFSLGRTRKARLFADRILELKPATDGAEYCEIVACQCTEPWSHCDEF